jgi:hypothetical protein
MELHTIVANSTSIHLLAGINSFCNGDVQLELPPIPFAGHTHPHSTSTHILARCVTDLPDIALQPWFLRFSYSPGMRH